MDAVTIAALLISFGTLAMMAIGARSSVRRQEFEDLKGRMLECEQARVDLARENRALQLERVVLMRKALGLPPEGPAEHIP